MSDNTQEIPSNIGENAGEATPDWDQIDNNWTARETGPSITGTYATMGHTNAPPTKPFQVSPFSDNTWAMPRSARRETDSLHFVAATGRGRSNVTGVVYDGLRAAVKRHTWLRFNREVPTSIRQRKGSKVVAWPAPNTVRGQMRMLMRFVNWVHDQHGVIRLWEVEPEHYNQFRKTLTPGMQDRFTLTVDIAVAFTDELPMQDRLPLPSWATSTTPSRTTSTGGSGVALMGPETVGPFFLWSKLATSGTPAKDLLGLAQFTHDQHHRWTTISAEGGRLAAIDAMNAYAADHRALPRGTEVGSVNNKYLATVYGLTAKALSDARNTTSRYKVNAAHLPVADEYDPTLPVTSFTVEGKHPAHDGLWFTPQWQDLTSKLGAKRAGMLPIEQVIYGLCFGAIALQSQAPRGSELRELKSDCLEEAFREDGSRKIAITVTRYRKEAHHRQTGEHELIGESKRLVVTNIAEKAIHMLHQLNEQRGITSEYLFPGPDGAAMSNEALNACIDAAVEWTRRQHKQQNLDHHWKVEPPKEQGVTTSRFRKVVSVALALHSGLEDAAEGLGHVGTTTTSSTYALMAQEYVDLYEQAEAIKQGKPVGKTTTTAALAAFLNAGKVSGQGVERLGDIEEVEVTFAGKTMTQRQLVIRQQRAGLMYFESPLAAISCLCEDGHLSEAPCLKDDPDKATATAPRTSACIGAKCKFSMFTEEGIQKVRFEADRKIAEAEELEAEVERLKHMPAAAAMKIDLLTVKAKRCRGVAKALHRKATIHEKKAVELVVDITDTEEDKPDSDEEVSLEHGSPQGHQREGEYEQGNAPV
jgi:hypothetical protein